MEPWQYRYIAAWGAHLGSQQYYIEAQQAKAAAEGAPIDALYRRCGAEGWVTVRDLAEHKRFALPAALKRTVEGPDAVIEETVREW